MNFDMNLKDSKTRIFKIHIDELVKMDGLKRVRMNSKHLTLTDNDNKLSIEKLEQKLIALLTEIVHEQLEVQKPEAIKETIAPIGAFVK